MGGSISLYPFHFITRNLKSSSSIGTYSSEAAAKNVGVDVPIGVIELGATDAAAMSQAGVPASALTAMDPTPARYYHTRLDTADNLAAPAIDLGVKVALETVFLYDEKGI